MRTSCSKRIVMNPAVSVPTSTEFSSSRTTLSRPRCPQSMPSSRTTFCRTRGFNFLCLAWAQCATVFVADEAAFVIGRH